MLALLAAGLPSAARGDVPIVLVVSRSWSGLEKISMATLRQLYLGRRTQLGGRRVQPLDLPSGSRVRRQFARSVLGRSEAALEEYWIEQALTGGPPPPRQVASPTEVLRAVAARPGTLGYLDRENFSRLATPAVRVLPLAVGDETLMPADPRYPIRLPGP